MVEIGLSHENLPNLCRLCLQIDDFIVDIFHRLDPNPRKQPLPDRIYELYQVKVGKADGLPTNICHKCLYYTETFTEFRDNVRKCEARLQNYVASMGILGSVKWQLNGTTANGIKMEQSSCIEEYTDILPHENSLVTVVDPNQEYNSSDDYDSSMDTDEENPPKQDIISDQQTDHNSTNAFSIVAAPKSVTVESENPLGAANAFCMDNSDPLKNVFLCQYCDMAFTVQLECAEHEARHDAANPHSCNYCPFRCANRQIVIAHIKELHDNERPYVCVQCNKGFGRRSDLKKHTIVHTGIRPFTCPVCSKNFSRNTNLTKHLRIHTGLKPHVCQKCPRSFTTTADLIRHQRVHNDSKPFQCNKCSSTFTRKDKLLQHERMHMLKEQKLSGNLGANPVESHAAAGFDTENMVIALDPFSDMSQAENAEHHPELVATPATRQFVEPLKISISKIIQAESQQPLASINVSPQQIHTDHITGDNSLQPPCDPPQPSKLLTCEMCPKKFSTLSSLVHHRNTHSGERNHKCPVCEKSFARKRELQRHSVIHTGLKPYACGVCNKRFNRKDKVVRHERIHAEEKFTCPLCSIGFLKQEYLDDHLKTHEAGSRSQEPQQQIVPLPSIFPPLGKLEEGFRPRLNFYNELKVECDDD